MAESKGDDQNYFGTAFWQIGNAWKRRAAAVLRPQNITYVQFMVLRAVSTLHDTQRIISQVDIASQLQANPMVVSSVIRSLKKQRLLSVRVHPRDSRAKRIDITDSGRDILKTSHHLIVEMESLFFETLQDCDDVFNQKLDELAHAHPFTLDA